MRKILSGSVVTVLVILLSSGLALAGNGYGGGGQGGQGIGGGTGISLVCTGSAVTVTGMVSDLSYFGSGMVVTTADGEDVTIYGIGPYRYWESQGVDRPEVGEAVMVTGMKIDLNGATRIVAMSITINETTTIELREECVDGIGGWPLWRGGWRNQAQ